MQWNGHAARRATISSTATSIDGGGARSRTHLAPRRVAADTPVELDVDLETLLAQLAEAIAALDEIIDQL
jgi:hypothetical protein